MKIVVKTLDITVSRNHCDSEYYHVERKKNQQDGFNPPTHKHLNSEIQFNNPKK